MAVETEAEDFALTEVMPRTSQDMLEDRWFAAKRHSRASLPPPRRPSVPPIDDDDVDPWLR